MRCLIVDDEALARRLLLDYAAKLPQLEVVGTCMNAIEAHATLQTQEIDLLFLDIQMPELTGIDWVKGLKSKPLTIFTTAYSEYALQAYALDVIDYLVKPIPFERFFQAVTKAQVYLNQSSTREGNAFVNQPAYFFVKADSKIVKVNYDAVLFIEGLREYVCIHTVDAKIITLLSMNKLEEVLPPEIFIRIHRSTIINIDQIEMVQGNLVAIGNHQLTISKSQKERFLAKINKKGLF
ncbi:MAG: LytR/AlgR family response regulator transcription factor [Flammeovirgaceae bacterium]